MSFAKNLPSFAEESPSFTDELPSFAEYFSSVDLVTEFLPGTRLPFSQH
jgi:hypothetical protein